MSEFPSYPTFKPIPNAGGRWCYESGKHRYWYDNYTCNHDKFHPDALLVMCVDHRSEYVVMGENLSDQQARLLMRDIALAVAKHA